MHYADIIAALTKAGYSQTGVAEELGVSQPTVFGVIRGDDTSYDVATFIAAVTNIPLNVMFPDGRYSKPDNVGRTPRWKQKQSQAATAA